MKDTQVGRPDDHKAYLKPGSKGGIADHPLCSTDDNLLEY